MRTLIGILLASLSTIGTAQAALYDRGGGLIYDDVLNVTWLQDITYGRGTTYDNADGLADGRMTWINARNWAYTLSYYDSARNVWYSDWRLPTVEPVNGVSFSLEMSYDGSTDSGFSITRPESELAYMYYVNLGNQPGRTPDGGFSSCLYDCLQNPGPFINLTPTFDPDRFWYGTRYPSSINSYAWIVYMNVGIQGISSADYSTTGYAWAVRDGDVAAVPEASTYAMFLAGLGVVAFVTKRRKSFPC